MASSQRPALPPPPGGWPEPPRRWGWLLWVVVGLPALTMGAVWAADVAPELGLGIALTAVGVWLAVLAAILAGGARIDAMGVRWAFRRLYWDDCLRFVELGDYQNPTDHRGEHHRSFLYAVDRQSRAHKLRNWTASTRRSILRNRALVEGLNHHLRATLGPPQWCSPSGWARTPGPSEGG